MYSAASICHAALLRAADAVSSSKDHGRFRDVTLCRARGEKARERERERGRVARGGKTIRGSLYEERDPFLPILVPSTCPVPGVEQRRVNREPWRRYESTPGYNAPFIDQNYLATRDRSNSNRMRNEPAPTDAAG